jgi:hypothetical protein
MCVFVGVKVEKDEVSEMRKHKSDEMGNSWDSAGGKAEIPLP